MGDRYNIHSQLEHLQSKYIGTGHADTNKWEWMTNQQGFGGQASQLTRLTQIKKDHLASTHALIPLNIIHFSSMLKIQLFVNLSN
jgi:hypothetical protein